MLTTNEVINIEAFNVISEFAMCKICNGIILNPVKCEECESGFCAECAKKWEVDHRKCPNGCNNFKYKESRMIRNMLEKLEFQCKNGCGKKLNYDEVYNHLVELCPKRDFKADYLELKKEFEKIQLLLKELQIGKSSKEVAYFQHMIPQYHYHPLIKGTTPLRTGFICDICKRHYKNFDDTYYCTYCDFDVCTTCFNKAK